MSRLQAVIRIKSVKPLLLIIIGYLLGSIPTGVLLVGWFRPDLDLQKTGSGNIGAANVGRVMGVGWGVVTMIGDSAKGLLPVLLAKAWSGSPAVMILAGLAAFIGHIYPVYLGFKGGKGVATALGILLGLSPKTAVIVLIIWAGAGGISRKITVGAISAAMALPIIALGVPQQSPKMFFVLTVIIAVTIFYTHRDNIKNIINVKTQD